MYKKNPKLLNQFQYCEREGVPFIVTVGEEEREKGGVSLRDVNTRKEVWNHLYFLIILLDLLFVKEFFKYDDLIQELLKRLSL